MDWNLRYAGLMDHTRLGPCTGDKGCGTCMHLDEIMQDLKPKPKAPGAQGPVEKITPAVEKSINQLTGIKKMHQNLRPSK